MGLLGAVKTQACVVHAAGADIEGSFGLARGEEADKVGHVAAADEEASAVDGVADHFGDPANGLGFDFAGYGGEIPRAAVGIDGSSEQIGECADGSGGGGDVSPEARVAVEKRVIEEERCGAVEEGRGIGALFRERARGVEKVADGGGRFGGIDGAVWKRIEKRGDAIDELVAEGAELFGRECEGRGAGGGFAGGRAWDCGHGDLR